MDTVSKAQMLLNAYNNLSDAIGLKRVGEALAWLEVIKNLSVI